MRTSLMFPVFALLWVSCAACDDSGGGTGQSQPDPGSGRHSHNGKKGRDKGSETKGERPARGGQAKSSFKLGRLDHRQIPESSGVIASRKFPEVFWTHNDSGNGPAVFAVTREGELLGTFSLNVRNNDWEAITTDDDGHLYVGDVGNNERQRDRVLVYRVDEPDPRAAKGAPAAPLRVGPVWRLKYPAQPFDAESLFVYEGKGYVISKLLNGKQAGLYRFDLANTDDVQTLEHVCDLPVRSPVTDAAISPDGKRLAVMTVTGPFLFPIDGDVAAAGKVEPKHVTYFDLKDMNMEGVCFVPEGLLATTEAGQILLFKDKDFE